MGTFLDPGIDLTQIPIIPDAECGLVQEVTASQIQQLIDLATPADNIGWLWKSNTAPPVSLYAHFKNFIWVDTSTVPPLLRFYYDALNSWDPYTFPPGSVSGSSFYDGSIPIIKLATGGLGNAGKVIVVNAQGTAWNYVFTKDTIADQTLPISRLLVPAGTPASSYLTHTGGGVLGFTTLTVAQIMNLIGPGSIALDRLAQTGATHGQVIMWDGVTSKFIVNSVITGGPAIPTPGAANNGQVLSVVNGNYALTPIPIPPAIQNFNSSVSGVLIIPTVKGAQALFAHGLGGVPTFVRAVLRCKTAHGGYIVGDEVDLLQARRSVSGDSQACWFVRANSTNVFVVATDYGANAKLPQPLTADTGTALVYGNWDLIIYAQKS